MNENLESEFEAFANDPQGCDVGFVEQRRESGFANFGFDPVVAAEMRAKELAGIDDEDEDEDDYLDDDSDLEDEDDDGWLNLDDDDFDYESDRFCNPLSLDEDEDE